MRQTHSKEVESREEEVEEARQSCQKKVRQRALNMSSTHPTCRVRGFLAPYLSHTITHCHSGLWVPGLGWHVCPQGL